MSARSDGKKHDRARVAALNEAVKTSAQRGITAPVSLTHARAWPTNPVGRERTPEERDAVVNHIAQDLQTGVFIRGVTWRKYAELGNCSPSMAQTWISEARRQNRMRPKEVQSEVRDEVTSFLKNMALSAYRDAETKGLTPSERSRYRSEAQSHFKLYAELEGIATQQGGPQLGGAPFDIWGVLRMAESIEWFGDLLRQASMGKAPELQPMAASDIVEQDPVLAGILARREAGEEDAALEHMLYVGAGTLDRSSPEAQAAMAAFAAWGSDGKTEDNTG